MFTGGVSVAVVAEATAVPPVLVAVVLENHWYVVPAPLAVTDGFVA